MNDQDKIYLGDGVYLDYDEDRDMLVLQTENGVSITNRIYLEPETVDRLLAVLTSIRG